jgi:acetyl esterase/lipase
VQAHVAAFASIDYRLSPHPNFPQDSNDTPESQLRAAKHPDHLQDVQAALKFLQDKHAFGEKYILIGHSCGATLAFQTVMNRVNEETLSTTRIPKPIAIVGVCGIYDLRLLRDDFKQYESVGEFIKGAYGDNEEVWDQVSPARVIDSDGVASGWSTGQVAVVASSRNDSLINPPQGLAMQEALRTWESVHSERKLIFLDDLWEDHDDVWSKGQELARTIIAAIESLVGKHS